jgi:hypothetical protein
MIHILFHGKKLEKLESDDIPDADKLVTHAMAQDVANALTPLIADIEKGGGEVTVDLKGPNIFEISTKDLSEKLR